MVPKREQLRSIADPVKDYGLITEGSGQSPLFKGRAFAEQFRSRYTPESRSYGALPYLKSAAESIQLFREEALYFSKTYRPKSPGTPPRRDSFYAEGMILFEAKFGKRLSIFAEEILALYPPLHKKKPGKEISIFGLSGSGKSTALEALRDLYGPEIIEMDSDTVRYHLLGRMIRDVELANGATLGEVRGQLMHNNISRPLYLLLHHLTKILKSRGYSVIRSSTVPEMSADVCVYISHPDGVDPRNIKESEIPAIAHVLFQRTQARIPESDDYDWEHAETVTDFHKMRPVSVQVPERVHASFLKSLRETLTQPNTHFRELTNKRIDDPTARKKYYRAFFEKLLGKPSEE